MYCKKCGKELNDNDKFCSNCGTPVTHDNSTVNNSPDSEEKTVKKTIIDTNEFVWDVHEFNKPARKIENVKVDWEHGTVIEIEDEPEEEAPEVQTEAEMQSEPEHELKNEFAGIEMPEIGEAFSWTSGIKLDDIEKAIAAERAKRSEEEIFSTADEADEVDETEADDVEIEKQDEDVPVTLEDIQHDVEAPNPKRERDTARIDKFFTLNKKNEEFQKLLDMEYERIKAGQEGSYIMPELVNNAVNTAETEHPSEEEKTVDVPEQAQPTEPFDPIAHLKRAEEERNAALGIGAAGIGAALSGMSDSHRSEVYYDENGEEMRIFDTMELRRDVLEASMPSAPAKSKNEIINEISGKIASTKEDVEKTYSSLLDEIFGQISEEHNPDLSAQPKVKEVHPEPQPEPDEKTEICEAADDIKTAATSEADDASIETSELPPLFGEPEDDGDYEEHGGGAGKVVIAILAILLLLGIATLGIKYFMPDSTAASFINDKLDGIAQMFGGNGPDANDDQIDEDSQDGEDIDNPDSSGDNPVAPDRSQVTADKTAVIEAVKGAVNKNVKSIAYNEDVKLDENHKYNSAAVAKTAPLSSNVLYLGSDGTEYYVDEEVVETLIAYDSGWIDYVNTRDNAIFDTLKPGSQAEKYTKAWNITGITKAFDSLEIGEIREDASGYYVWAHEIISTTQSGKTTTDEYNWVYYMELVNGNLLIVDYYK